MSWVICVGSSRIGLAVSRSSLPRQHQLLWDCASQQRGASLFLAAHPHTGSLAMCHTFCFVFFMFKMEKRIFCQGVHNVGTSLFTCNTIQNRAQFIFGTKTKQQTYHTCLYYKYISSHHIFVRVVGAHESELKAIVFFLFASFEDLITFLSSFVLILCTVNTVLCGQGYTVNTVGRVEKFQCYNCCSASCEVALDQQCQWTN